MMFMSEKLIIKINSIEYKNIFTRVIWSGGINGTSRKLEVEYLKDNLVVNLGNRVEFFYNGELLFVGKCFFISKKGETKLQSFYCYDDSIYLNKNKFVKNFFKKKPSEIFKQICGELNLKTGSIPRDEVDCTYPAIDKTGYEIILNAYRIQHKKNKKIYSVVCNDGIVEIVEQGSFADVLLSSVDNIETSLYEQNIENLINQIVIYKTENGKVQIINKVENAEDKKKFGLFQAVLEYEKDSDSIENAREMLKSVESSARLKCLGNILLQSGYSIGVEEPNTGLVGNFLIKNDTHVFEGSNYYCDIELAFENVMDKVEFEEKEKKKKAKSEKNKRQYSIREGVDYEPIS